MFISNKNLEYILYIEGVRVPFNSASVTIQQGVPIQCSFNITPIDTARKFMRGMTLHLFKSVNGGVPKLRFHGITTNSIYSKNSEMRSVVITAASADIRWDRLVFSTVDVRPMGASQKVDIFKQYDDNTQNQIAMGSNVGLMSGSYARSIFSNLQGQEPGQLKILTDNPQIMALLKERDPKAYDDIMNAKTKPDSGTQIDGALFKSFDVILRHYQMTLLECQMKASVHGLFEEKLRKPGGNILSGLIDILMDAYTYSNGYVQNEYDRMFMGNSVIPVIPGFSSPDGSLGPFKVTPMKDPPVGSTPIVGLQASDQWYLKGILSVIKNMIDTSSGVVPIKPIIMNILSMLFYVQSADPLRIDKYVVWHPLMLGFMPPRANVIFPEQYSSLNYNPNQWSEITRSAVLFPSVQRDPTTNAEQMGAMPKILAQRAILCDYTDPVINRIKPPMELTAAGQAAMAEQGNGGDPKSINLSMSMALTEEECWTGCNFNIRPLANEYFSRVDADPAATMANYLHFLDKYSTRTCSIIGELLDDVIVGMPIVILDKEFSIYGLLESASYSLTPDGQVQSDLSVACPRYVYNRNPDPAYPKRLDDMPKPLEWVDVDDLKPQNIGAKLYKKLYGCLSIADPIESSGTNYMFSDSPATVLEKSVDAVLKEYDTSANKRLFVERYRARIELSEDDVFKTKYKATSQKSQDAEETQLWMSPLFNPVKMDIASGDNIVVDRQKIVIEYLREYFGKPGRLG